MRNHHLIDQLAELAGQRNRDALDSCFLDLFHDLMEPLSVAIFRPAGDERAPHWSIHRRARDSALVFLEEDAISPPLPALPAHFAAWQTGLLQSQNGVPAVTVLPMGCHDETHCLVEIVSATPLSGDEERLIQGVQRFYRHLRALLDENERDSLTRLLNRKSFDETFVRMAMHMEAEAGGGSELQISERRRLDRAAGRCWLAVVDIDHFKRVNDTHGHLIGDEVLILLSQLMRKTFRTSDRLYRFGGEEFVVLLRSDQLTDARNIFERLRSNVTVFEWPRVGELTVSIGFTEVLASDTPSAAFERADQAVYHAKSHGRNQVVHHEDLISSGEIEAKNQVTEVEFF